MPDVRASASTTDAELLARVRDGDETAFSALVTRHHAALVRVAEGYVRMRAVAEEVAQDTWVAVLERLAEFEGRSSVRTWIFRICANRAISRAEREQRSTPVSALARETDEPSPHADQFASDGHWANPLEKWARDTPESLVADAETRVAIEQKLAELPTNQRAVVTLRDVEGWTSEEVCEALGLSEGNQRVLLHRGRQKLRDALQHLVHGEVA